MNTLKMLSICILNLDLPIIFLSIYFIYLSKFKREATFADNFVRYRREATST